MLFPIFIAITLIEIYVLISVGEAIGGFFTIVLVVVTALMGSNLLKQQGFTILQKVQQKVSQGQSPSFEMLEGVVIMVSGILLLTPGFVTDSVGILGLMPLSRRYLISHILTKNQHSVFQTREHSSQKNQPPNNTIEGEFWED
jgi:UPF0716 protein FxsA